MKTSIQVSRSRSSNFSFCQSRFKIGHSPTDEAGSLLIGGAGKLHFLQFYYECVIASVAEVH